MATRIEDIKLEKCTIISENSLDGDAGDSFGRRYDFATAFGGGIILGSAHKGENEGIDLRGGPMRLREPVD